MKASIHTELKKNLQEERTKLKKSFDNIHNVLEQCLSKGVEESVQSCVTTTMDTILRVSVNLMFYKMNHHFLAILTLVFFLLCHSE